MDDLVYCAIVCEDPLIIMAFDYYDHERLELVAKSFPDREIVFIVQISSSLENWTSGRRRAEIIRAHEVTYPLHRIFVAANTAEEVKTLKRFGTKAIVINHNTFIDPDIFEPKTACEKEFSAIYVGGFLEVKRFELSSAIDSVAIIGCPKVEDYFNRLKREIPGGRFLNEELAGEPGGFRCFPSNEIAEILHRTRVGLCLSAVEGAMYSSIEYLLAGLPVVSTPSEGGRDFFFHPDFVEIADPTPEAIAAAVQSIQLRAPPAEEIRSRTIALQQKQIATFIAFVDKLVREEGGAGYTRQDWDAHYIHKMFREEPLAQFLERLPPWQQEHRMRDRVRRLKKRLTAFRLKLSRIRRL